MGEFWPVRVAACDDLIARMQQLRNADPPIDLASHNATAALIDTASPTEPTAYKLREDLIDACLCAWTAALWARHGLGRCQVLGTEDDPDEEGRVATIIAPARPEQRPA